MASTKKSLAASGLALLASAALLAGTTFAWFTDSVTNTGNRIQAGTLEVDLLMDKEANGAYASIADSKGDIFSTAEGGNGILWEPGKTEIVYLAVENKGSLALNYNIQLDIIDGGLVGSLQYAVLDGAKAADLVGVDTWTALTALTDQVGWIADGRTTAAPYGKLLASDAQEGGEDIDYFALAVHMDEEAGNDYQGKSIDIDVTVIAKQATVEEDGFNNPNYDTGAEWPSWNGEAADDDELASITDEATKTVTVSTPAQMAAIANMVNSGEQNYEGYTIRLEKDLDLNSQPWTPIGNEQTDSWNYTGDTKVFKGSFDGQGHTISNLNVVNAGNNAGFFGMVHLPDGASIENITFRNAVVSGETSVGVLAGATSGGIYDDINNEMPDVIINIEVNGAKVNGTKYVGGVIGYSQSDLTNVTVSNTEVTGIENAGAVVGDLKDLFTIDSAEVIHCVVSGESKLSAVAGSSHHAQAIVNCTVTDVEMVIDEDSTDVRFGWISGRVFYGNVQDGRYSNNTVTDCVATRGGIVTDVNDYHLVDYDGNPVN